MTTACRHPDIRKFDGIRTCLACGEVVFENALPSPATDDAQEGAYQYSKLNYTLGQEIRLLVVDPGEPGDPIRCDIIVVNLEDDPAYEALSYTWATEAGDASFSETIYCRTGTLKTTKNCHAAIRRLRKRYAKRRLWIDAVCINQDYILERNHQVTLMEKIYSRATRVLIYLDSYTYRFEPLFRWLDDPADKEPNPEHEDNVLRLLRLRWFRRVWVIQEVALAKTVRLFTHDAEVGLSARVVRKLRHVWGLRPNIDPWPSPLRWTPESRETLNVSSLLRATRGSFATDERDKVYAILSLIDQNYRKYVPIDYSMNQEWVFAKLTSAIIIHDGTLDVLYLLGFRRFRRSDQGYRDEDLPSWIPTYSDVPPQRITQFQEDSIGNWNSTFSTQHLRELESGSPAPKRRRISTAVDFLPRNPSPGEYIKPRLRIRAHYLDRIERADWVRGINANHYATKQKYTESASTIYKNVFHANGARPVLNPLISQEHIESFLEAASETDPKGTHQVFRTTHSIGFASFDSNHGVRLFDPDLSSEREGWYPGHADGGSLNTDPDNYGDDDNLDADPEDIDETPQEPFVAEVFALDGARSPFILRKQAENQYKIVTACYLMGALQYATLRKKNIKGPWGEFPESPSDEERTRMIEIV